MTMSDPATQVLLVESDAADAALIQASLAGTGERSFRVERVPSLASALARLGSERFDVILLDLRLSDS